jgi:hypothetical protein
VNIKWEKELDPHREMALAPQHRFCVYMETIRPLMRKKRGLDETQKLFSTFIKGKILQKWAAKHAKLSISFCMIINETIETACFAFKQNFAKQRILFSIEFRETRNETGFARNPIAPFGETLLLLASHTRCPHLMMLRTWISPGAYP